MLRCQTCEEPVKPWIWGTLGEMIVTREVCYIHVNGVERVTVTATV